MEATKRIQLNIDVRNYRIGSRFLNINDTIFPVLWINEVNHNQHMEVQFLTMAIYIFFKKLTIVIASECKTRPS